MLNLLISTDRYERYNLHRKSDSKSHSLISRHFGRESKFCVLKRHRTETTTSTIIIHINPMPSEDGTLPNTKILITVQTLGKGELDRKILTMDSRSKLLEKIIYEAKKK